MIFGSLNNIDRYYTLHPLISRAMEVVFSTSWEREPLGRRSIIGDELFINYDMSTLSPVDFQPLEYHKKYLDIHIPLTQDEVFGWKPTVLCKREETAYDSVRDFGLYCDKPETYVTLKRGMFAIVFPEDAHAPIIGDGVIKKLVVKILL